MPTPAQPALPLTPTPTHPPSSAHTHTQEPSHFTGSYVHDRFPDSTECAMAVAFKGASWTDPDSIPLMVMQTMLGEGVTVCVCVCEGEGAHAHGPSRCCS